MSDTLKGHLEKYEIEAELGRDDLTIAYRAHRKSDGMPVVVKVVAPQFTFDAYFVRRFKDAVTRQINLDHPNIVKTFEVGERQDLLYTVRELVEAETLTDYLAANGGLPMKKVVALVKQIASALDYGHGKAMRHGNLSDANVFIKDDHVWVTDFGLTQTMEDTSLAKKGFAVGDPAYLSPERVKGESPSRIADLYALGILTYQMLTGKPPFSGEAAAVLHAQVYEQPEPPHVVNPNIRPVVSEAILRMLSKGLELRYSTGVDFARALQVAVEGSAPVSPLTPLPSPFAPHAKGPGTSKPERIVKESRPPRFSFNKRLIIWPLILMPLLGCALVIGFWFISQLAFLPRPATPTSIQVAVIESSFTPPVPTATLTSVPTAVPDTPTSVPTVVPDTPTPVPPPVTVTPLPTATLLPVPGEPIITKDSPFSNLVLASGKTGDNKPDQPTNVFSPADRPIYLFFDYASIEPGASWDMVWKWDGVVLENNKDVWPEDYGTYGTAWIYFSPSAGFQPGPHSVSLKLEGDVVATVNFIVQPN